MKTYFEAHRERLENNQTALLKLAGEVLAKDPTIEIYHYKDQLIPGLIFIKGEKINSVHFHEVPYRWSGCGHREFSNSNHTLEMPFSADDVLSTFKPIAGKRLSQVETFKNKAHYLKSCSYLTRFTPKN